MRIASVGVTLALVFALVGCGGGDGDTTDTRLAATPPVVHAFDGWVGETTRRTADVSVRLHNAGAAEDRLLEATCACEATVEIDGAVVVGPEEEVVVTPDGTPALVLTDLAEPLRRGAFVTVTLTFERAGDVTAELEVRPQQQAGALGYPSSGRQRTTLTFRCL